MNLSQDWNAEISFSDSKLDYRRMPGEFHAYAGSLDALRVFNRERVVAPYISLGLGALSHLNGPNQRSSDFLAIAIAIGTGSAGRPCDQPARRGVRIQFGNAHSAALSRCVTIW